MVKDKLLIVPIFKSFSLLRKLRYKKIIQNKRFRFGAKIKNINNLPFKGAKIKKIRMFSGENKNCEITCDKEFEIKELNPEENLIIWFDHSVCPFSGMCWFDFELENKDSEEIITYQWDIGSRKPTKCDRLKGWQNIFIIKDEFSLQQEITNWLLIILTIFIVLSKVI